MPSAYLQGSLQILRLILIWHIKRSFFTITDWMTTAPIIIGDAQSWISIIHFSSGKLDVQSLNCSSMCTMQIHVRDLSLYRVNLWICNSLISSILHKSSRDLTKSCPSFFGPFVLTPNYSYINGYLGSSVWPNHFHTLYNRYKLHQKISVSHRVAFKRRLALVRGHFRRFFQNMKIIYCVKMLCATELLLD